MQDSLGLWIGDVPVWNRISKHDWQDAWILDLARGSLLNQPWGHLAKFDRDEVDFMADWHDWMKRNYRVLHSHQADPRGSLESRTVWLCRR